MGIIGNFFGLILNGGYLTAKKVSQGASDARYNERAASYEASRKELYNLLCDYDIEKVVSSFLMSDGYNEKLKSLCLYEIAYIGDDLTLSRQQAFDLLMSKFGKVSSSTLAGCARLGNLEMENDVSSYTKSIRVLQCIESNILHCTGRKVMFGVSQTARSFDGKYCSARVEIFGMTMSPLLRIYESTSVPFKSIEKGELSNV